MRLLAALCVALMTTACGDHSYYLNREDVDEALRVCQPNGGLKKLEVRYTSYTSYCINGAVFNLSRKQTP